MMLRKSTSGATSIFNENAMVLDIILFDWFVLFRISFNDFTAFNNVEN